MLIEVRVWRIRGEIVPELAVLNGHGNLQLILFPVATTWLNESKLQIDYLLLLQQLSVIIPRVS